MKSSLIRIGQAPVSRSHVTCRIILFLAPIDIFGKYVLCSVTAVILDSREYLRSGHFASVPSELCSPRLRSDLNVVIHFLAAPLEVSIVDRQHHGARNLNSCSPIGVIYLFLSL